MTAGAVVAVEIDLPNFRTSTVFFFGITSCKREKLIFTSLKSVFIIIVLKMGPGAGGCGGLVMEWEERHYFYYA